MNESNILLFNSYKKEACCSIYDYQLKEISSFGQQNNEESSFFMQKSIINWREEMRLHYNLNPKLFGYDDNNEISSFCQQTKEEADFFKQL
jgi:hypothetical protein